MQWEEEKPKCPACGAVPAPGAEECAGCGVVFAKWAKKQARELPPSERQLDAPPPILVRDKDSTVALVARFVGISLLMAAGGLGWWLLSGGSSRASVAGAIRDDKRGFAFAAPTGWSDHENNSCAGSWNACEIRYFEREPVSKERFPERIALRVIGRGPDTLDDPGLEKSLEEEVSGVIGVGNVSPAAPVSFDGLKGIRIEGRGSRHFKIETSAAVNVSVQGALAEQRRLNPNAGVYSVQTVRDFRNPNGGYVKLKEAEYAEFDARAVAGRVVVPARSALIILDYQYDLASESAATSAIDEILASLRVQKRPRGMDGISGALAFVFFSLAAGLAITGAKLLTA